jgi:hypothetical protein
MRLDLEIKRGPDAYKYSKHGHVSSAVFTVCKRCAFVCNLAHLLKTA